MKLRSVAGGMIKGRTIANRSGTLNRSNSQAAQRLRLFDIRRLGERIFESDSKGHAEIAVIIPLYNYATTILECLESVASQDLEYLSVIIVDDASSDDGVERTISFLNSHVDRFSHARVVRHKYNQGLAMARNSGIVWSSEPFLFLLDADNRIRPPALSRLLQALNISGAAFAYSQLRFFGEKCGIGHADIWEPSRLVEGNYIDAMALIRRDALETADGYAVLAVEQGWEDYDLWCRFAELGLDGVFVPELLCEYRVHAGSMLRTSTNDHYATLMAEMALRHPSLFARQRGS